MLIQQLFFFFVCQQSVDDIIQLSFHDTVELIDGQTDTVIGDAVLRIVVGTDLFGTVAGTDLGTADRTFFFFLLLFVVVVDSRSDDT